MPFLFAMAFVICHIYTKFSKSICHLSPVGVTFMLSNDKALQTFLFICNFICHLSPVTCIVTCIRLCINSHVTAC